MGLLLYISAEYLSNKFRISVFEYLSNSKLNGMIERSVIIAGKTLLAYGRISEDMVDRFHDIESILLLGS